MNIRTTLDRQAIYTKATAMGISIIQTCTELIKIRQGRTLLLADRDSRDLTNIPGLNLITNSTQPSTLDLIS